MSDSFGNLPEHFFNAVFAQFSRQSFTVRTRRIKKIRDRRFADWNLEEMNYNERKASSAKCWMRKRFIKAKDGR